MQKLKIAASAVLKDKLQVDREVVKLSTADFTEVSAVVIDIEDYRKTNRGGKGVKTLNITDKTGSLVAIKSVTEENDLMIINKSGITIRLKVADVRIMGRATQGVRLIDLEKRNDQIGSVCKVASENEEEVQDEATPATDIQPADEETIQPATDEPNE